MKNLPVIIITLVAGIFLIGGVIVWQKSQIKPAEIPVKESMIKKVDMSAQPEWVQNLKVVAKKGTSQNGLENVTVYVDGMPKGIISTISYVIQYQTSNKGTQGSLSTTPIKISGETTFSRIIDLGTCSTKSCVRHDGVIAVEIELDFTTTSGDTPVWSNTINL